MLFEGLDLPTVWFALVAVLFTGYALLDGFDLGVGAIHLSARTDEERRVHLNAIGPVWDGNEVWLLTGGGALFAAFPSVYATVFSGFYLALILVLMALIFRAVSIEVRSKHASPVWRSAWDIAFSVGSGLAALLFGVAMGNLLRGIPLDASREYAGSFFDLLNPFSLILGVIALGHSALHGALFAALKTEGEHRTRLSALAAKLSLPVLGAYIAFAVATPFLAPHLSDRVREHPALAALPLITFAALAAIRGSLNKEKRGRAFGLSCVAMASTMVLFALLMFPALVRNSADPAASMTAANACSSPKTLNNMLIIALIGMPLVIGYTVFIYRIFHGKVTLNKTSY